MVMEMRCSGRLEKSKYPSYLEDEKEERFEELQAGQLPLSLWEGDGKKSSWEAFPNTGRTR